MRTPNLDKTTAAIVLLLIALTVYLALPVLPLPQPGGSTKPPQPLIVLAAKSVYLANVTSADCLSSLEAPVSVKRLGEEVSEAAAVLAELERLNSTYLGDASMADRARKFIASYTLMAKAARAAAEAAGNFSSVQGSLVRALSDLAAGNVSEALETWRSIAPRVAAAKRLALAGYCYLQAVDRDWLVDNSHAQLIDRAAQKLKAFIDALTEVEKVFKLAQQNPSLLSYLIRQRFRLSGSDYSRLLARMCSTNPSARSLVNGAGQLNPCNAGPYAPYIQSVKALWYALQGVNSAQGSGSSGGSGPGGSGAGLPPPGSND